MMEPVLDGRRLAAVRLGWTDRAEAAGEKDRSAIGGLGGESEEGDKERIAVQRKGL